MKAFVAALSLLAAGASAEADPQFFVGGSPLVHSLAYNTPYVYTVPKAVEKKAEDDTVEVKKVEYNPVVYTHPAAPFYQHQPIVYKTAEKTDEEQKVFTYAAPHYYQPYAAAPVVHHTAPVVHHTAPVVYTAAKPVPKYVAKNGEVEHKVYKRSADADADAEALVYYNTYGYWPTGYTGAYVTGARAVNYAAAAAPAISYAAAPTVTYTTPYTKYVAPSTVAYNANPYYYGAYGQYYL